MKTMQGIIWSFVCSFVTGDVSTDIVTHIGECSEIVPFLPLIFTVSVRNVLRPHL